MRFTTKDQKCARDTQNGDRICLTNAPSTSPTMSGRVPATQTVKLVVAHSPDTKESPQDQLCPRSLEDSPANTSSTLKPILLCPVTGKPIPSLKKIEETIEKSLTLSNWRWPRSIAVKGIALALQKWALEVGLEKAAKRCDILFGMPEPMKYADAANMPWIKLEDLPQLTPEAFAERLGGIVDGIERTGNTADQERNIGDQRLLSSDRSAPEDGGTGCEPGDERVCEGDSDDGDGRSSEGGRLIAFHSGGAKDDKGGLSRRLVCLELQEHRADLKAFQDAYGCIHRRIQSVKDDGQLMKMANWSGTSAVMGSLELSIHAIERVVEELKQLLFRIDEGFITNEDQYEG